MTRGIVLSSFDTEGPCSRTFLADPCPQRISGRSEEGNQSIMREAADKAPRVMRPRSRCQMGGTPARTDLLIFAPTLLPCYRRNVSSQWLRLDTTSSPHDTSSLCAVGGCCSRLRSIWLAVSS